jgi:hypothetical protein
MPLVPFRNGHTSQGDSGPPRQPPILEAAALDPAYRLSQVLKAEERAQEEWDEAIRIEADIDPADFDVIENARKNVRNAYRRWFEVSAQAHDLAESVRKSKLESNPVIDPTLIQQLKEQFTGGGPHYELLCERVAGLHTRLRHMEASGRDFSPSEHAQLNTQLLAFINQLQKYTEAMKSETISKETQEAVEEVLRIVERHLGTTYLEVWHAVVKDVRRALEESAA